MATSVGGLPRRHDAMSDDRDLSLHDVRPRVQEKVEKDEDKERSCPKCRSNSIRHLKAKALPPRTSAEYADLDRTSAVSDDGQGSRGSGTCRARRFSLPPGVGARRSKATWRATATSAAPASATARRRPTAQASIRARSC